LYGLESLPSAPSRETRMLAQDSKSSVSIPTKFIKSLKSQTPLSL
jgi:hypothetical protein